MVRGPDPAWLRRSAALSIVFALTLLARSARADGEVEGPPVAWSVGAGCALMFGAMAAGGGLAASSTEDRPRKTGFDIFAGGVALVPVLSHGVAGEWKRAGVFGAITVPLAVTAIVLLEESNAILNFGHPINRVPFGAALAVEVMVSGVGLSDSLMAGERARQRRGVAVVPMVGGQALGLSVGGVL